MSEERKIDDVQRTENQRVVLYAARLGLLPRDTRTGSELGLPLRKGVIRPLARDVVGSVSTHEMHPLVTVRLGKRSEIAALHMRNRHGLCGTTNELLSRLIRVFCLGCGVSMRLRRQVFPSRGVSILRRSVSTDSRTFG